MHNRIESIVEKFEGLGLLDRIYILLYVVGMILKRRARLASFKDVKL